MCATAKDRQDLREGQRRNEVSQKVLCQAFFQESGEKELKEWTNRKYAPF